ncbi:lactaldehyde reductase [Cloacibacillus porcorum]|jgi:lactaldehyde reductase|uniref:Lactaldehyde reductase n=2 Tax=Cloacibacillus porcorum TaxID=1197717 RepID=A0A1B2I5C6_9BACT|nr:lactaldehyde reductase [Cloacibacillus porcorum]ANZ45181.1 lactaldehyde reductase [Cloacibacillus porcorum]MCC8184113.1 lactaldehyde reductase [Cloacibacillus porcorum]MCI5864962.1 lactaldehyde reductase [Cloacibacillus porcorum]MDY5390077.1 lactaldehyde reductase [Cloacibacillus porcorum]NMF17864.1 lactaldehyde reductase [Cloacibacillus porcorum]
MANRMVWNGTAYFGAGAIKNIPEEVARRGFKKALIVTDKDLIKFGVAKKVFDVLEEAGLAYAVFDSLKQNPTIKNVQDCVAAFKAAGADYMIAIGGGSSMDTAKGTGIIINNPEYADVRSLEGVAPTKHPAVPTFAVPTTAGTAAETTINYVITDEEKRRKFVCVDPHDIPQIAVVDADMMSSMPKGLAAATGMDALTHAIEGYITPGAWELSDMFSLKSIQLIADNLRAAVNDDCSQAKENMALGQYVTGMAYSNVGLGLVHGMAHPLGAFYDMPHGVANALLLPYIMEYNADYTGEKYREIARVFGVEGVDKMSPAEYRRAAVDAVRQLSKDVHIPQKLSELNVKEADLEALTESAFADVCTPGNPRKATKEDILALYKEAF